MATYKVIQDIEAEDRFVGPLSLKQFIFAMGGGLFGYLSFFAITRGYFWLLALTLPPSLFGFFMAVPWSKDQPTDVWVLAKLRFRLKPKKRIWNQDGTQDLVTITAPKKEEKPLTNNMSEGEVKSRLKALAETIDSRGWAVKHAEFQNRAAVATANSSQRLVTPDEFPAEVPEDDTAAVPDILGGQPKIDNMLQKSAEDRKERIYEKMDKIRHGEEAQSADTPQPVVAPPQENMASEQALSANLKAQREAKSIGVSNMHSIPAGSVNTKKPTTPTEVEKARAPLETVPSLTGQAPMTEQSSPDILELARNSDFKDDETKSDEVVISLH